MGSPVRFGLLVLLLLPSLRAQTVSPRGDYHTLEDEGRRLYAISAFAHGHRHGYEEGYRLADQEIHFGLRQRELAERDVPNQMEYKRYFGDRKLFRRGFVHGFLAGYRASYANEPLRVPEWLHEVPPFAWADDLPQGGDAREPTVTLRRAFDDGARAGYEAAWAVSVTDAGAPRLARQAQAACQAAPQAGEEGFCAGFRQGFLLAVRDRAPAPPAAEHPAVAQSGSQPH